MPDDASPSALTSTATETPHDETIVEAYRIDPESLDAWDRQRPGLKAFLWDRIRQADEDAAADRLIPHEEVFARLRARLQARIKGEQVD